MLPLPPMVPTVVSPLSLRPKAPNPPPFLLQVEDELPLAVSVVESNLLPTVAQSSLNVRARISVLLQLEWSM